MMRHLILGLLRQDGPCHGYALMKKYRAAAGRTLNVGNLYRELRQLRAGGFIRLAVDPLPPGQRRRPYEITAAGTAVFDGWLGKPCRSGVEGSGDDGHALRAFFVLREGSVLAPRVLGEWREELRAGRRELERVHELLSAPHEATLALWLGRRLKHLETDLQFVSHLESALESVARPPRGRGEGETSLARRNGRVGRANAAEEAATHATGSGE